MIGTALVRELVETVILSGRVKNGEPVSLLLIASPESGKTSVACEKSCKTVMEFSDLTGKGVQELCKMNPEISHFVINDMVAVMAHKQTVNRFTFSMLSSMTEEGIRATAYPDRYEAFQHGKRGIIACLTHDLAKDGRSWWNKTGFSSRMFPFCYHYPEELIMKIKESISKDNGGKWAGATGKKPEEFKVPKMPIFVDITTGMAGQIAQISDHRAKQLGEQGIRRLKQYRNLARAHALFRGWKKPTVTQADIFFLKEIDRFCQYDRTTPL